MSVLRTIRLVPLALMSALCVGCFLNVDTAAAVAPGWLLRQAELEVVRLTGDLPEDARSWQADVGGVGRAAAPSGKKYDRPLLPMLMSLILPGAGEAYLGHKRGFFLMAADIAAWYGGAHNAEQGRKKSDEYYVFADRHWFEEKLDAAYDPSYFDRPDDVNFDYGPVVGIGTEYFGFRIYNNEITGLPLWVSAVDDRREYYENLGKWDQFVFGWDDFVDPRVFLQIDDFDTANLRDPRTSANREIYREMRRDSNDAFARRDRFLYLNVGLRVFSVLQVAYLEGLLFGGNNKQVNEARQLAIGGHRIDLIVEPVGLSRGIIGAVVSF